MFYVARFDELAGGDRVPGLDELLRIRPEANMLSAPERHRWRRVHGEWRRAATTMHFIGW
ncbi:MAG TPA: hypothetical protein VKA01_05485 [Vicinamibacteria bacterium]|nr:hypothetical protein [Vicinamibacteria bacterium]